jgi:hypothetical protein
VNPFRRGTVSVTAGTTLIDAVVIILAGIIGAWRGGWVAALLVGGVVSIAIGVWRCVTLLGHLLERSQANVADHEDA